MYIPLFIILKSEKMRGISDKVKRTIYVFIGTIFLVIGAIGVVARASQARKSI